jgi:hypothetical protein
VWLTTADPDAEVPTDDQSVPAPAR